MLEILKSRTLSFSLFSLENYLCENQVYIQGSKYGMVTIESGRKLIKIFRKSVWTVPVIIFLLVFKIVFEYTIPVDVNNNASSIDN